MISRFIQFLVGAVLCAQLPSSFAVDPPNILLDGWQIELVRSEPDLVTPIGCRFDSRGRLYVVECHTHFPQQNYDGPKVDRIYRFIDTDDDGRMDTQRLFYEGGIATMGLAVGEDGWIYVATRSEIKRIRDQDNDGTAETVESLIKQETTGDYPHDGLSSLTFSPDGWLYFGQGENLGHAYRLLGQKGSVQAGGGEGGNIYRCRIDGSQLERVATGLWNPFGTCFDSAGRFWAVENDPDSRPPCRLLQIVESGDYGFQFRFGRAGTNPLLAWNGELPGTLPMAAGTGEAPCAILPYGDHFWVSSWGDNRIERFKLFDQDGGRRADFSIAVQGDVNFRPVDMTRAPDGSIYITDWVDRSYNVHKKGRLWRLSATSKARRVDASNASTSMPPLTQTEVEARRLATDQSVSANDRWKAAHASDPFLVQAAVAGLVRFDQLSSQTPSDAKEYLVWLQAWRWRELSREKALDARQRVARLTAALKHEDPAIRRLATRYAAESGDKTFSESLRDNLKRSQLSATEFSEIVAAISYLENGNANPQRGTTPTQRLLIEVASSADRPVEVRAMALHALPNESTVPSESQLDEWVHQVDHRGLRREAILLLANRRAPTAQDALIKWANDKQLDSSSRADAVAALARHRERLRDGLEAIARNSDNPAEVTKEAARVLSSTTVHSDLPDPKDFEAWWTKVGSGGDPSAGQRVFMRSVCSNCHAYQNRGPVTGPDLSTLHATTTRKRILESILDPSREIGPLYVTWRIVTADGRVLTGAKVNASGIQASARYLGADGNTFDLRLSEIEDQRPSPVSIMPADAYRSLTIDELRDLLAFLE